jgi:hypothetical protein
VVTICHTVSGMYTLLIGALFSSYINPHKRRWDSITDQTLSLSYPVDSESMKHISRNTLSINQIYEVNISLPLNPCSLPIISDFFTVLEPRMVACSIKVNISYVYQSAITQLISSWNHEISPKISVSHTIHNLYRKMKLLSVFLTPK